MTPPRRPTIALAAALWNLSCIAAAYALVPLLVRVSHRLPDLPVRTRLTLQDRNVLFAGTGLGALLGYAFGVMAAFVVLPSDFTAPVQHPPTMALVYTIVAAAGLLGTLLATWRITLFASTSPLDAPPATVPQR
jgi:hypothetical protein